MYHIHKAKLKVHTAKFKQGIPVKEITGLHT